MEEFNHSNDVNEDVEQNLLYLFTVK